jgi:hypothetical protein
MVVRYIRSEDRTTWLADQAALKCTSDRGGFIRDGLGAAAIVMTLIKSEKKGAIAVLHAKV